MRRRPGPEAVSPRALARLRGGRGGWVPTAADLGRASHPGLDPDRAEVRVARVPTSECSDASGRHRRVLPGSPWVRVPAALVDARWQPGRAAVLGVLLVSVVVVSVLGLRVAWAGSGVSGEPVAPGAGPVAPMGVSAGVAPVGVPSTPAPGAVAGAAPTPVPAEAGGPTPAGKSAGVLVVHVVGEVESQGVQRLPVGSRVADAIEAAGGPAEGADLTALNLARLLVDGEQVQVPEPGEVLPAGPQGTSAGPAAGSSPGGSPSAGSTAGNSPLGLNSADAAALDTLPGIGPVLAQRIVDWRTQNGRFTSVEELTEVSGIGEKLLGRLRPLVTP